jgi:signal transduction histidine kinase
MGVSMTRIAEALTAWRTPSVRALAVAALVPGAVVGAWAVWFLAVVPHDRRRAVASSEMGSLTMSGAVLTATVLVAVLLAVALFLATRTQSLTRGRSSAALAALTQTASSIDELGLSRRFPVSDSGTTALAASLNEMLDRLEGASRRSREALDDAAHELRTPLAIIRGHLELLDDDPVEREATRALVLEEIDRMNRILSDLLLLASAQHERFLHNGSVDVAELTRQTASRAKIMADRDWVVDGVATATVTADGQRLSQAMLQLAANAVAHTRPGDRIRLGSQVLDGRLRLWVQDSGPGVRADLRRAIFDRWGRGPCPDTAVAGGGHVEGLGLGLAIVRSIARAHGGDVRLEDCGGGARFVLDLPSTAAPEAKSSPAADAPPKERAPAAATGALASREDDVAAVGKHRKAGRVAS